jgi:hypothetical protein
MNLAADDPEGLAPIAALLPALKPGDLPAQGTTKYETAINLKTEGTRP